MKFNNDPTFLKKRIEAYKQKKDNPNSTEGDFLFKQKMPYYTAKDGENIIRLLPAMWEGSCFPWIESYIHYSIGPNNSQFFCLAKMQNKPCPVCEEANLAKDRNEKPEVIRTLWPQHRAIAWVVDRLEPSKGPVTYNMPYKKIAHQIISVSFKRTTGEPVFVDDPVEGWDIIFNKTGKGLGTDYSGIRKDDEPTPLHADPETAAKWLQVAETQNIKEALNFQEYVHIKAVLFGLSEDHPTSQEVGEDIKAAMPDKSETVTPTNGAIHTDNSPVELTMAKLKAMPMEQLIALIEQKGLGVDASAWNSDELPEVIGLELGLNP